MTKSAIHAGLIDLLPRLRRFAMVLVRNPDAADDLVQASVERALSREYQWQPDSRLDRWMFQIMRTVWLNSRRAAVLRHTEPIEDHLDSIGGHDGVGAAEARLTMAEVRSNFQFLLQEQQQAMMLVCVEGYTYAEAADLLGIPIGTVISRLTRGRMTLMARQAAAGASGAPGVSVQTPSNVAFLRRQGSGR